MNPFLMDYWWEDGFPAKYTWLRWDGDKSNLSQGINGQPIWSKTAGVLSGLSLFYPFAIAKC